MDNMIWQPPRPSTASRKPPKRSKGSFSGASVDPIENRVKVFESYRLELGLLLILMADRRVAHIQDQPAPVTFVTPEGQERTHAFDFLVTFRSGKRVAEILHAEDGAWIGDDTLLFAAVPARRAT